MKEARLENYILHNGVTPLVNMDLKVVCRPALRIERTFEKGVKTESKYIGVNDEVIGVKKWIEDIDSKSIIKVFELINEDGEIYDKKEVSIHFSGTEWESRKRKQRVVVFDDLKDRSDRNGARQYIEILYAFFKDELQDWYETGSDMFKESIMYIKDVDLSNIPSEDQIAVGTVKQILNSILNKDVIWKVIVYQMS